MSKVKKAIDYVESDECWHDEGYSAHQETYLAGYDEGFKAALELAAQRAEYSPHHGNVDPLGDGWSVMPAELAKDIRSLEDSDDICGAV